LHEVVGLLFDRAVREGGEGAEWECRDSDEVLAEGHVEGGETEVESREE
jgi:hypothetical protein